MKKKTNHSIIVKTALIPTILGTLATPVLADPVVPPPPNQYIPPVFCFRIMDIDVTGEDRFRFEFEVLNWTDTQADDIAIAIAAESNVNFVRGSGSIIQPSTLPFPDGGGNQIIPNDWTVDPMENGRTAIHWDGGTPILNIDLIQIAKDTENVSFAQARNDAIAAINAQGFPNNDFNPDDPETVDNGTNVLGGFVFEADDFDIGDVLSFNWFLTNGGVPIGTADGRGNAFGFGNLNIARGDLFGNFPDPLFSKNFVTNGFVQDAILFAPDDDGNVATIGNDFSFGGDIGIARTAVFENFEDSQNICGPEGCPVNVPVPEPLTILGTATAMGFGSLFKIKRSKK